MRQFLVLTDYSFSLNGINTITVKKDDILNDPSEAMIAKLGDRIDEFFTKEELEAAKETIIEDVTPVVEVVTPAVEEVTDLPPPSPAPEIPEAE